VSTLSFTAVATRCYALVRLAQQNDGEIAGHDELTHGAPCIGSERSRGINAIDETSLFQFEPPYPAKALAQIGASILRLGDCLLKMQELDAKSLDLQAPRMEWHRDIGAPTTLGV
jgi:hypothetical protein